MLKIVICKFSVILWDQQAYFIASCGPNPTSVSGNFMGNVWCRGHGGAAQSREHTQGSVVKGCPSSGSSTAGHGQVLSGEQRRQGHVHKSADFT